MPSNTTNQDALPHDSLRDTIQTPIVDAASRVGDQISDAASTAKNAVSEFGRTAVNTADENRATAARKLDTVASTIREKADSLGVGETVGAYARSAADSLSSTADYVRENNVSRMMADLERVVKNNPGPSLLAAAAVGFLVGRAFSSRD